MKNNKKLYFTSIFLLCVFYILAFTSFGLANVSQYGKFFMLFISSIFYFFYFKPKIKKNDIYIYIATSIFYGLVLIMNRVSFNDLLNWIIVVVCYLINIMFIFSNLKEKEFKCIVNIIYGTLSILLVIPSFLLTFNSSYFYLQSGRYRFISFMNNANELAQFTSVVFFISIFKLFGKCSFIKKLYHFIISLISFFVIYQTGSRAALILVILFLLLLILGKLFKIYTVKKELAIFVSLVIFICIMISPYLISKNTQLFNIIDTLSSNRLSIWQEILMFKDMRSYLIGGQLIKASGNLVITNAFIEIFGYLGLIGVLVWLVILITRIQGNSSNGKIITIFQFALLFSYLIYYQFESGINGLANISSYFFWLVLCYKDSNNIDKLEELKK